MPYIEIIAKEMEKVGDLGHTRRAIFVSAMLSVATGLDATAVSLSMTMLKTSIIFPSLVIGVVASALSTFGLFAGNKLGETLNITRTFPLADPHATLEQIGGEECDKVKSGKDIIDSDHPI